MCNLKLLFVLLFNDFSLLEKTIIYYEFVSGEFSVMVENNCFSSSISFHHFNRKKVFFSYLLGLIPACGKV